MDYNEARPQIVSGDVIAFSHEGWKSWSDIESQIVRMATRSEFSHVGVAWVVAGRVMILEAVVPMIRIFPLSKLTPFYWMPLNKGMSNDVEEYALSRIGEEYSKWEAIRGFFGKTSDNGKWQCAELTMDILQRLAVHLPGFATPTNIVHDIMDLNVPLIKVTK
jgi:hypothetical protein